MASVNKVILIGNLGKDPELKMLPSGMAVAKTSLATSETFKDKSGEKQTKTQWHNLTFWGKTAEIVDKYAKKGQAIYIEGSIEYRTYEKDGVTKNATDIRVSQLSLLGSKNDHENKPKPKTQDEEHQDLADDDDLPF